MKNILIVFAIFLLPLTALAAPSGVAINQAAGGAAGNWGSDSITVNYTPVVSKYQITGGTCTGCQ